MDDDRPGRGRVAANAAWLMAAEVVGKLSGFVLVVILARGLGPRQYGYFAFALAFLPLFLHLARWGIDITVLRRIAAAPTTFSPAFVNGAVLRLALAVAATLAGLALVPLFVEADAALQVVVVLGVALLLDEVSTYLTVAFTAFEQLRFNAMVLVANRVLSTALAGVVVAAGGGVLAVCGAYLGGSAGAVVVAAVFLVRRLPPLDRHDVQRSEITVLFREGAPLGFANFLNMAVFRIDAVLLEAMKGPVAVGFYGVAYRFFEPLLFVTWSIAQATTPRMVRETAGDERGPVPTFERGLAATLSFYLPVAVGTPFAAQWLLERLFGSQYAGAEAAVIWLAAAALPYGIAHLARHAAVASGERRAITTVAAAVLAGNVVLNVVLIPTYGVSGAAAATFFTEVAECVLLLGLYARRVGRLRVSGSTAAPVVAAACMGGVLLLGVRGGGALLVGPPVYAVVLGALSAAQRRRVRA